MRQNQFIENTYVKTSLPNMYGSMRKLIEITKIRHNRFIENVCVKTSLLKRIRQNMTMSESSYVTHSTNH